MFAVWRERRLESLLEDHARAVREFIDRARRLNSAEWRTARGEGKWTPAQETMHVILAYEAFLRDLSGGATLRLKGNPFLRRIWRMYGLTSILLRKRIPVAVRAPREIRPDDVTQGPDVLLPLLEQRVREFESMYARYWRDAPRRKITHPFFGRLSLDHAMRFACVHTRHHAAFLPRTQGTTS